MHQACLTYVQEALNCGSTDVTVRWFHFMKISLLLPCTLKSLYCLDMKSNLNQTILLTWLSSLVTRADLTKRYQFFKFPICK